MEKILIKLVTHVGYFLKSIAEGYSNDELPRVEPEIKVVYDFDNKEARIYVTPQEYFVTCGTEATFDWTLVDRLTTLSDKYKISYRIGSDEKGILHFQIYVV
jgi:hypothetical protein